MKGLLGLLDRIWDGVLRPILNWIGNHIWGIFGLLLWSYVIYTLVSTLWVGDYSYVITCVLIVISLGFYADSWSINKGKKAKAWFSVILVLVSCMFIGAMNNQKIIEKSNLLIPFEIIKDSKMNDSILIIKFNQTKDESINNSGNLSIRDRHLNSI